MVHSGKKEANIEKNVIFLNDHINFALCNFTT